MGLFAVSRRRRRLGACAGVTLAAGLTISIVLGAESPATGPAAPPSIWDGVFSSAQVGRGKKGYDSQCARCHGEALGGGEDSPALVNKEFLKGWDGKTLGELVEYTREEMPSDGPGKLTRKQCTDITAFVLSVNDFPAGPRDLEPDLDKLNQILITRKK